MRLSPFALYRIYSHDGRLLYVGCSMSFPARIKSHEKLKPWATEMATVKIEWFSNRNDAITAERNAIAAELPEWNVHHRDNPKHGKGRLCRDFRHDDPSTWVAKPRRQNAAEASQ